MAFDASASKQSPSVIPPGAACKILIFTSSVLSSDKYFVKTSTDPWTSARMIRFKSFVLPASIWLNKLSSVTPVGFSSEFSLESILFSSAAALALLISSRT
jgi:hypothetical protein